MKTIGEIIFCLVAPLFGNTLKARCARSSAVLGIGVFVAKLIGFGGKVILTRLLAPEDLGLMVMILSLNQLFEVMTEIGIKQSVIQHKNGADREYLNMAWWFQSLRAMGLYAVAFMAAPWLCEFYFRSKPEVLTRYSMVELITLVRVAFLAILFNGFISPKAYVLEKTFRFAKAALITQGGPIVGAIVTIILAFTIRNVWAIVIGFAAAGLARCIISYALCPLLPAFTYHRESFHGLCRFGRGMFGLPVFAYIAFYIDVLVAGKLVSTSLVGFYGMALTLAIVPWDLFTSTIYPVLLPAFSEKQDDKKALCNAVVHIAKYIALFLIPPMILAMICSRTILTIVYGENYSTVAVPFSLFCIYAVFLIQGCIFTSIFYGIGKPGTNRTFMVIRCLILVLLIYPGIKYFGLTGAAAVILLANFIALCLQLIVMHKTIGLNILKYAVSWLPGLAMAIPVFIIVTVIQRLLPGYPRVHLAAGVLSCIIICLGGMFIIRHFEKSGRHLPKSIASVELVSREEAQRV